jgi:hypothetical protein
MGLQSVQEMGLVAAVGQVHAKTVELELIGLAASPMMLTQNFAWRA